MPLKSDQSAVPLSLSLPLLLLSMGGWGYLWEGSGHLALPGNCGLSAAHWLDWGWAAFDLLLLFNPPDQLLLSWLVMIVSMMAPLIAGPLAHLRPHGKLMLAFILAYIGLWMLVGAVLMGVAVAMLTLPGEPLAYGVVVAGLWQVTPLKRRCLRLCHWHPAGPILTVRAAFGYGRTIAVSCLGSCWALMLLPLLTRHAHFMLMVLVTALFFVERGLPRAWWSRLRLT